MKFLIILIPFLLLEGNTNTIQCINPKVAKGSFTQDFKYGCFCGKNYPNIKHKSQKNYKYLNKEEKKELIATYNKYKAYDSIDEVCKQHDICYIKTGDKNKVCNDIFRSSLLKLRNKFNPNSNNQCRVLASDIAATFSTIFVRANNNNFMDFGMSFMNTPLAMTSIGMNEVSSKLNGGNKYPSKGEKCNVENFRP